MEFGREFGRFDDYGRVSQDYIITVLLEIIRAEGDLLLGFSYLAKKCYLAEKMRGLDVFGFVRNPALGVFSSTVQYEIRAIRSFGFARVLEEGEVTCGDTKNYCGEARQEHITLHDEEVVRAFLDPVADNADFKEWQEVISRINHHPHGKDWHIISVAVCLHAYLRRLKREGGGYADAGKDGQMVISDIEHHIDERAVIEDIRKRATIEEVSLSEGVIDTSYRFLDDLGL